MLVFGLVSLAFPVSVWGVDRSRGAMDQAALQRVTLARSSGTLCWTAWGAREQQSLRTLIGFLLLRIRGYSAGPLVGRVVFI